MDDALTCPGIPVAIASRSTREVGVTRRRQAYELQHTSDAIDRTQCAVFQ